jgi:hypothetical protein
MAVGLFLVQNYEAISVQLKTYFIFETTELISNIFGIESLYSQLNITWYVVLICIGPVKATKVYYFLSISSTFQMLV